MRPFSGYNLNLLEFYAQRLNAQNAFNSIKTASIANKEEADAVMKFIDKALDLAYELEKKGEVVLGVKAYHGAIIKVGMNVTELLEECGFDAKE